MSKGLPKILLIDSNALIHRSFHALPPLTTAKGEQVNAVYGFANTLLKAIKDEKPDYVVACFDAGRETFRNEIYKDYKAHRKETDEALSLQIPRVKQIVECLNIPLFAQKGVEADDLIGSLSKIATKQGLQTVIVTGDKDAFQLVNDSVTVYSLKRGVTDTLTYDRAGVKEKMGVFPEQVVDFKALSGDASDGIPGAPGIGPKTTVDLLAKYHDLEGVYQHLDELKERTARILTDNKELVMISQKLAQIKNDLDIDLKLSDADVSNFDFSKVIELFHELDFRSLLAKLPNHQPTTQAELFSTKKERAETRQEPTLPYELVRDKEHFEQITETLMRQRVLTIDTETVDLGGELIGIAYAWSENDSTYLPLQPHPQGLPLADVKDLIDRVLLNPEIKKIGHNLKYDLLALDRSGIKVEGVWFDTMIASQLINSQLFSHRLDDLAYSELSIKKIPTTQLLNGDKSGVMTDASAEDLAAYACEDVLVTHRLYLKFAPDMEETSIKRIFYDIEMPLLPVLVKMEQFGIKLNSKYLQTLGVKLKEKLQEIERSIVKSAGKEFNVASPAQLQQVLFTDLKLSVVGIKKIKSGYSTDAETLGKLQGKHPIVPLVLEYREIAKLLSTYIDTLPTEADANGRIHTSFQQIGAATGRMASNNPNLQNIPIRTELGNQVRQAFVADKDRVLLGADYSQAELRVMAHLSEDPSLIEAFHQKSDFHAEVAKKLSVTRREAKAINFGIIYGLGSNALANDIGTSTEVAKQFIDRYFATFPGVARFIEQMKQQAKRDGYVSTVFGRRRYLPDIHSPNMGSRAAAERMAVNHPAQGTVADLVKMSMIQINKSLFDGANMLLQIHDELLFEVDKDKVEQLSELVRSEMSSIAELKVPLIVDIKTGPNWGDLQHQPKGE